MRDVYICDAIRTPIGRFGGGLAAVRADDLAAVALVVWEQTAVTAPFVDLLPPAGNGLLHAAPTLASVIKAEETDGKPPVLVDGGLLGALGAGMDEVQGKLGLSVDLLDTWSLRSKKAADEAGALVEQAFTQPSWNSMGDFLLLSAIGLGR